MAFIWLGLSVFLLGLLLLSIFGLSGSANSPFRLWGYRIGLLLLLLGLSVCVLLT